MFFADLPGCFVGHIHRLSNTIESSFQCFCSNSINSGASLQPYSKCGNLCLGNWWQDCGGSNYINVFHKTSSSCKKVSSTATAQSIPSAAGVNTRTTSTSSVSSTAMSSASSSASSASAAKSSTSSAASSGFASSSSASPSPSSSAAETISTSSSFSAVSGSPSSAAKTSTTSVAPSSTSSSMVSSTSSSSTAVSSSRASNVSTISSAASSPRSVVSSTSFSSSVASFSGSISVSSAMTSRTSSVALSGSSLVTSSSFNFSSVIPTSTSVSSDSAAFSTGSATVTSSVSGFEITFSTSATIIAEVIFSSSTSADNASSSSSSNSEAAFITDSSPNPESTSSTADVDTSVTSAFTYGATGVTSTVPAETVVASVSFVISATESASSIVSPIASETETEATSITSSAADIATSISISISSTEESTTSSTAVATSTAVSTPSGWSVSTCIGEGSTGRALTGTSTSSSDMTEAKCAAFCAASGYTLAGIEYSSESYCGSILSNGASLTQTSSAYIMPCSADSSSICGGPSALTLVVSDTAASTLNSDPTSKPASLPSGWSVASSPCIAEGTNGRALAGASTSGNDMTLSKCASYCMSGGLTLAAVEYSSQCYCSSVLNNGASLTKTSNACTMTCAGDSSSICGGPDALTLMVLDSAVSKLNSDFASEILSLPPVWSAASTTCIQEGTTGRALPSLTYASDDMTIETCVSFCDNAGWQYAGVSYGREC
ncbi:hypothetical protein I314_04886 [Cryptococcus bacillisporus CA1873]|uniref:WSC domain-containing protein n=1 Tax=Cryptococcus bacillisporus CA1873 TaxID=1296111 RepID=A0ABR5B6Y3_CRYGA|nr:hypothetical protein I314_04886 [Cryptococcus bacillisporus CA1873]|eukprot:KIR59364.1 hypothetical protein I314_04886 [Cryptococcus gattii CA1873]